MNFKQEAAKKAVTFIKDGAAVGLGMGATMAYMVEYIKEEQKCDVQLYSSSVATKNLLKQQGFLVNDISTVSSIDIYFDGCDQFDKNLNALKSGGGIHTIEKLFASMANEFILVGDESKYAEQLQTTFPVVLEVMPQAITFVMAKIHELFDVTKTSIRHKPTTNDIVLTEHGNYLLDMWFAKLPQLSQLNPLLKSITGIIETSLFYSMATKAVIAGNKGVSVMEKYKLSTSVHE